MDWRSTPTGLVVRLFAILAAVTFIATSQYSRTVFITSIVVVMVLGVLLTWGLVKLRRHFARYPTIPKSARPVEDHESDVN
ncbi:hypothetical protein CIW49_21230 [Mycolicibacterium sp. P1-18]|nr:hypothetical protein CIW49_21230 [Mycolicibacterium sp. P1-18]